MKAAIDRRRHYTAPPVLTLAAVVVVVTLATTTTTTAAAAVVAAFSYSSSGTSASTAGPASFLSARTPTRLYLEDSDGSSMSKSKSATAAKKLVYSDDWFGLVAIGSGVVGRDAAFAGTFVLLSAVAAALCNNADVLLPLPLLLGDDKGGDEPNAVASRKKKKKKIRRLEKRIPAVVAGATLLVAPAIRALLLGASLLPVQDDVAGGVVSGPAPYAPLVELGTCWFSIFYGFVLTSVFDKEDDDDDGPYVITIIAQYKLIKRQKVVDQNVIL